MLNGTDVLVLVNTGTEQSPTWTPVASQRDVTFDETNAVIDFSSKDARARRVAPGRYSSTISLDALYVPDHASYAALSNAMRDGTMVQLMRSESGSNVESVPAMVSNISSSFPDQGEATIAATFDIDGTWTPVGS